MHRSIAISGLAQSAQRQPEKAVASFRQALASDPNLIDALNGLGNALRDLGDRRQAASLFRRAIELDAGRAGKPQQSGQRAV